MTIEQAGLWRWEIDGRVFESSSATLSTHPATRRHPGNVLLLPDGSPVSYTEAAVRVLAAATHAPFKLQEISLNVRAGELCLVAGG